MSEEKLAQELARARARIAELEAQLEALVLRPAARAGGPR
jgi:hypothetical protein